MNAVECFKYGRVLSFWVITNGVSALQKSSMYLQQYDIQFHFKEILFFFMHLGYIQLF